MKKATLFLAFCLLANLAFAQKKDPSGEYVIKRKG